MTVKAWIRLNLLRFSNCRRGNVAIIFALSVLPILLAVSVAIDFTRASDAKARLDAALDAATLYAAEAGAAASASGNYSGIQTATQTYFNAELGSLPGVTVSPLSYSFTTTSGSGTFLQATASYSATIATIFGNYFQPTIAISGSSSAKVAVPTYIDFYLLLDNSPSMGIAASTSEMTRLEGLTANQTNSSLGQQPNCEFACHIMLPDSQGNFTIPEDGVSDCSRSLGYNCAQDAYTVAKAASPPVQLRIDVLASAVQTLTQTAQSYMTQSGLANQYRMAIYTFNSGVTFVPAAGTTASQPLSGNMTAVAAAAATVTIAPYNLNAIEDLTNYTAAFSYMNSLNITPGSGQTASAPQKYVFFVTDGVSDETSSRIMAPIDSTLCSTLKNNGVTVAVLYTPYIPLTNNGFYNTYIAPFIAQVPVSLQACASPGFYFTADTSGIAAAMQLMFQAALSKVRLTN
jgi:Flp pilus assembly protein TadG